MTDQLDRKDGWWRMTLTEGDRSWTGEGGTLEEASKRAWLKRAGGFMEVEFSFKSEPPQIADARELLAALEWCVAMHPELETEFVRNAILKAKEANQ